MTDWQTNRWMQLIASSFFTHPRWGNYGTSYFEYSIMSSVQLTVVHLLLPGMDLWRATLAQQRIQRCSTGVTQGWFQREGWELCALGMGGAQTLLTFAALWVSTNSMSGNILFIYQYCFFLLSFSYYRCYHVLMFHQQCHYSSCLLCCVIHYCSTGWCCGTLLYCEGEMWLSEVLLSDNSSQEAAAATASTSVWGHCWSVSEHWTDRECCIWACAAVKITSDFCHRVRLW